MRILVEIATAVALSVGLIAVSYFVVPRLALAILFGWVWF